MRKSVILDSMKPFPLFYLSFAQHVHFIFDKVRESETAMDYDIIWQVANSCEKGDTNALHELESMLQEAREILGVSEHEFRDLFKFKHELRSLETEKEHDILVEPQFAVDLRRAGFSSIRKLQAESETSADFVAEIGHDKYALEVKTIRPEVTDDENSWRFRATNPGWWHDEFRKSFRQRISQAKPQLDKTREKQGCQFTVLAVYSRRSGQSLFRSKKDLKEDLSLLKEADSSIDFLASKFYGSGDSELIFFPAIPTQDGVQVTYVGRE